MFNNLAKSLLLAFSTVGGAAASAAFSRPESLMSRAANARLEPNAIIDERCLLSPHLNDTLSVSLNVFIATYLQLIALTNTTASGTQIIKRVGLLDTNRGDSNIFASLLSIDANDGQIPKEGIIEDTLPINEEVYEEVLPDRQYYAQESQLNKKFIEGLSDNGGLAIGRFIEVAVESGGKDAAGKEIGVKTVPIAVRLMATIASTSVLKDAMESRFKGNQSALERKHGWKSGRLSLISDILLGTDAVKAHRRRLMKDVDGIYDKLSPNSGRNIRNGSDLIKGRYSIAEASSILVIDQETADEVELSMGGRFKDRTFRDRLLEATGVMTLAIIDRGNDMVTFYYDSIADGTRLNSSALKNAAKKDGPDIGKILEQFLTSSAPRF